MPEQKEVCLDLADGNPGVILYGVSYHNMPCRAKKAVMMTTVVTNWQEKRVYLLCSFNHFLCGQNGSQSIGHMHQRYELGLGADQLLKLLQDTQQGPMSEPSPIGESNGKYCSMAGMGCR